MALLSEWNTAAPGEAIRGWVGGASFTVGAGLGSGASDTVSSAGPGAVAGGRGVSGVGGAGLLHSCSQQLGLSLLQQ
jgi:hypothetical protein